VILVACEFDEFEANGRVEPAFKIIMFSLDFVVEVGFANGFSASFNYIQ